MCQLVEGKSQGNERNDQKFLRMIVKKISYPRSHAWTCMRIQRNMYEICDGKSRALIVPFFSMQVKILFPPNSKDFRTWNIL